MFVSKWETIIAVVTTMTTEVQSHGFLAQPPARNTMWRVGFDTPANYNDMGLNCGGFDNQWNKHGGKCGLCGDPYQGPLDHEVGGKYAPKDRPISRCYNQADNVIDITAKLTAYHKGYFEFRLCENNDMNSDPSQECLDNGYILTVAGSPGVTRYDINDVKMEYYTFQLDMPSDVICSQCILHWTYNAGNSYGCDASGCGIGLGPQEQFINCADIAILPDCEQATTGQPTETKTNQPTSKATWSTHETEETDQPTTNPITDEVITKPITDLITTDIPRGVCVSAGEWAGSATMDEWCMLNCLHSTHPNCPETHCKCSDSDITQPTSETTRITSESDDTDQSTDVCVSAGDWAGSTTMDEWCMFNCLHPTYPYCPETHCKCS